MRPKLLQKPSVLKTRLKLSDRDLKQKPSSRLRRKKPPNRRLMKKPLRLPLKSLIQQKQKQVMSHLLQNVLKVTKKAL